MQPHSPGSILPPVPSLPGQPQLPIDVQVDLVLLEGVKDAIVHVEKPFNLRFSLVISATLPAGAPSLLGQLLSRKTRVLTLAVQHTLPAPPVIPEQTSGGARAPSAPRMLRKRTSATLSFETTGSGVHTPASHAGSIDLLTPRRVMSPPPVSTNANAGKPVSPGAESMVASPTSVAARAAGAVTVGGLTERLRRVALSEALGLRESESGGTEAFGDGDEPAGTSDIRLPMPYSSTLKADDMGPGGKATGRVQFSGSSVVFLPPIVLASSSKESGASSPSAGRAERGEGVVDFALSYLPRTRGFARVGGLRVLLLKDQEKDEIGSPEGENEGDEVTLHTQGEVQAAEAQILREWDVVSELWIR